jgi:hypothetical protein
VRLEVILGEISGISELDQSIVFLLYRVTIEFPELGESVPEVESIPQC